MHGHAIGQRSRHDACNRGMMLWDMHSVFFNVLGRQAAAGCCLWHDFSSRAVSEVMYTIHITFLIARVRVLSRLVK
jgi:hypothetical protein